MQAPIIAGLESQNPIRRRRTDPENLRLTHGPQLDARVHRWVRGWPVPNTQPLQGGNATDFLPAHHAVCTPFQRHDIDRLSPITSAPCISRQCRRRHIETVSNPSQTRNPAPRTAMPRLPEPQTPDINHTVRAAPEQHRAPPHRTSCPSTPNAAQNENPLAHTPIYSMLGVVDMRRNERPLAHTPRHSMLGVMGMRRNENTPKGPSSITSPSHPAHQPPRSRRLRGTVDVDRRRCSRLYPVVEGHGKIGAAQKARE
ncbi:hypothetical protein DFP72DRAFT_844857 [Ephemerocybe angulata]|uniref:Uncharacterized protein n=1 Tax=Ephemerocybe angulata TaxID=980116 RepID=A0A8H6I5W1_9AGAR|nr:hypothetical protein DFP72DRAFT_844857 [Tulosesus angulatus]